ncbi:protein DETOXIFICATION 49 [Phoenix dactylifera]|uniref:Protein DETOXIFICATION n=1 Tax=Phoenix dactylifera TaxID=42345 RepID=A0A8B7CYR6_PHODC|nr:protein DETOXIFICATION 49 [Phoenix dactylifera]
MCNSNALSPNSQCEHHTLLAPFVDQKHPSPPLLNPRPPGELALALLEAKSLLALALPMVLSGLLFYSRSMISMLFLGRLGRLPLAGGTLAIGFANITGYSILSGLATGMEPICSQAFGANKRSALLRLALRRTVLLLLTASLPIAALWAVMHRLLLLCGQDPDIAAAARSYILTSLPDLLLQSFLHPLRVYLRAQSIIIPLTYCAAIALLLHIPINYLLVSVHQLGIQGVALASVSANFNLLILLVSFIYFFGIHSPTSGDDGELHLTKHGFDAWRSLIGLAIPSCISVCLEWWWYEIMILLCGLLLDPKSTVASMGILIQTTSLLYIFPSSLSYGVSTRVGNELGANRPDRARRAAAVGLSCGAALGLAALVFAVSVRNAWAAMFTDSKGIAKLTAAVLPILGLCELGNCPQTVGCGVLRGCARPRAAANINLVSFYGFGMPVAVGLAFFGGFDFRGLWLGLLAAQAACVATMLSVVRRTDWDLQAERAQRLTKGAVESDALVVKVIGDGSDESNGKQATKTGVMGGEGKSPLIVSINIDGSTVLT